MKIVLFILLSFVVQVSYGQCDNADLFSDMEKETFVQIYLEIKDAKPTIPDQSLYELAAKYKISPEQFRDIQNPLGSKRALTAEEKLYVEELQKLQVEYERQTAELVSTVCLSKDMAVEDYKVIHKLHRSCIRFQKSLSVYFEKWMR